MLQDGGQVDILDYRNEDDFVLELKTRAQDDLLILAKLPPAHTLGDMVRRVHSRVANAKPSTMAEDERICVPVLDFDILKEYPEVYNHPIKSANRKLNGLMIKVALQAIRFRLDDKGSVLRSEALLGMKGGPGMRRRPRTFYFDKPFLVLLKRKHAKNPYFALWVANTELMKHWDKS